MNINESRHTILNAIQGAPDVTFVRSYGNIGDQLIYAGTRQLLHEIDYSEVSIRDLQGVSGHTALLAGSGGWCWPYHEMPKYLPLIERRFQRVIVLPSSFETSVPCVREALRVSRATVFARECDSFTQIKAFCDCRLALDCAFFFDYRPYQRKGAGVLTAYREDDESAGGAIPRENDDISATCESLDEWLWKIASCELIRTDRAHVTIAAALLGKRVEYCASNYHKLPAIVSFALKGYPVIEVTSDTTDPLKASGGRRSSSVASADSPKSADKSTQDSRTEQDWEEKVRITVQEIEALVQTTERVVIVDEDQLRNLLSTQCLVIPFLERDGMYWGPPFDDAHAIRELTLLREQGARMLIVTWPAFWWLEHYRGWDRFLRENFRCLIQNDKLIAFDLRDADSIESSPDS